jgi:hypothetical protein
MQDVFLAFLKDHFQRIVFSFGVLFIAWGLYLVGEKGPALTLVVGVATLWMNKARSPRDEKPSTGDGQSGESNIVTISAVLVAMLLIISCTTNMPSKYDTYDGCLICDIAKDKGIRLEDVGNLIRVAGAVARAEDVYTRGQAVEAMIRIRTALEMPVTGVAFVEELELVAEDYREEVEIAMAYAQPLAVPQLIDDQSVKIMLDFIDERIARLRAPG